MRMCFEVYENEVYILSSKRCNECFFFAVNQGNSAFGFIKSSNIQNAIYQISLAGFKGGVKTVEFCDDLDEVIFYNQYINCEYICVYEGENMLLTKSKNLDITK